MNLFPAFSSYSLTFPLFNHMEIERFYLHVIKKQKDTMRGAVERLKKLINNKN